ncbi:MAG: Ppx/GppA phosphatase family protein [Gemmatimonadales bacterium]
MIANGAGPPAASAAAASIPGDALDNHLFAAVDIGSNSFHLIVARFEHGQLQVIDRLREMVRLASGLDDDGKLVDDARDRALECLARFGERLSGIPGDHVRALATNTLRRMRDPRPFLLVAETSLGHSIEIISGHEEARLIHLGVTRDLPLTGVRRLIIDIGGGSTELIVGVGDQAEIMDTVAVGCVSVSEQHFPNGKITRSRFKAAETAVALELRPIRDTYKGAGWEEVVGSSGTNRAIAQVLHESGWTDSGITRPALKKVRQSLIEGGKVSRSGLPGLSDERSAVFPGGVAVLSACLRNLEIAQMSVSDYALREGALYDLIGRVQRSDPREASVAALATRYGVDLAQATRVRSMALRGFAQVAGAWELTDAMRDLLGWAAQLHEVGLAIAHTDYHRHGAYLAQHSTLNGFSREEQLILSALIFGHRRKLTSRTVAKLPPRLARPVTYTCVLLRMAVLLHRSRQQDEVPNIRWEAGSETLKLEFPKGWLETHPLTGEDLEREQNYLKRVGIRFEVR